MNFTSLHHTNEALLITNVWDVPSAKTAEKLGYKAIGTSSAAIAEMLGYNDGEELSFSELCYIVKRILARCTLPLSVDIEAGYSKTLPKINENIKVLADLGVVGINIEDSIVTNERALIDSEEFSTLIKGIKEFIELNDLNIFLNARTDTYILNHTDCLAETKKRLKMYDASGADGVFIPCVVKDAEIKELVELVSIPVNVMCMPSLSDFKVLTKLGVKRISMGNFVHGAMMSYLENELKTILNQHSFKSIF